MTSRPCFSQKIFNAVAFAACALQCLAGQNAFAGARLNVAIVSTTEGGVDVNSSGAWKSAQAGDLLPVRAQIRTGAGGKALLVFVNGASVQVGEKTSLTIDSAATHSLSLALGNGRLNLWVKKKHKWDKMIVRTPAADIKDIGTDWGALYCENDCGGYHSNSGQTPQNGLYVDVSAGKIVVSNGQGAQEFSPGQFGYIGVNQPPIILPPANGMPIATDKGINKPPESVLGNSAALLAKSNQPSQAQGQPPAQIPVKETSSPITSPNPTQEQKEQPVSPSSP